MSALATIQEFGFIECARQNCEVQITDTANAWPTWQRALFYCTDCWEKWSAGLYWRIWNRDEVAMAQRHIKAGTMPSNQGEQMLVCDEHDRQCELVQWQGHCEFGCGSQCMVEHRNRLICRWTWQPCEKAELAQLLEIYGQINRGFFDEQRTNYATT